MKCPNCYREIPSDSKFCPDCGKRIEVRKSPKPSTAEFEIQRLRRELVEKERIISSQQQIINKTTKKEKASEERDLNGNIVFNVDGTLFKMIHVEGGTFTMGATSEMTNTYEMRASYVIEKPTHKVTLSNYYIGETEVTQELWLEVMGTNPSYFKGAQNPVECVSWNECQIFIKKLNQKTGKNFRLPTEAEWEYAARGGRKSNHTQFSGSNKLCDVAWSGENSENHTHPVKQKKSNELGIYDMTGNVAEWCQDWYGRYSDNLQVNPTGPISGTSRVSRGIGWNYRAPVCRISNRENYGPDFNAYYLGLRLALSK